MTVYIHINYINIASTFSRHMISLIIAKKTKAINSVSKRLLKRIRAVKRACAACNRWFCQFLSLFCNNELRIYHTYRRIGTQKSSPIIYHKISPVVVAPFLRKYKCSIITRCTSEPEATPKHLCLLYLCYYIYDEYEYKRLCAYMVGNKFRSFFSLRVKLVWVINFL